ncbi:MAG: TIGR02300 family protein [Pseudomonadota bacterium]
MAKPEWGIKRICFNCGARYYDMQRDPIICPSCETEFDPEALLRARRVRSLSTT